MYFMSTEKRSQIYEIADQLLREGIKPTQQNVRERLGSGSLTTINRALNEWWEQLGSRLEAQTQGFDLPDPVVKQVNRLWSEALAYADKASNQKVEALQKQLAEARAELSSIDSRYSTQIIDLNKLINQLRVDISTSDITIKELRSDLKFEQDSLFKANRELDSLLSKSAPGKVLEQNQSDKDLLEARVRIKIQDEEIARLRAQNAQLSEENAQLKYQVKRFQEI
jgi:predicted RNase H-like nuclease (RuvC/YqgF family)